MTVWSGSEEIPLSHTKVVTARSLVFKLVATISIWWVASIITSTASRSVLEYSAYDHGSISWKSMSGGLGWLELTILQLFFSAIASVIVLKVVYGRSVSVWPTVLNKVPIFIASLTHVAGSLAVNAIYALLTPSGVTQVIRQCEPLFVFFLSLCLYKEHVDDLNVNTLLSLVTMIAGACAFVVMQYDASYSLWGLFATVCSSMGLATRNILLKRLSWESALQKYAVISVCSMILIIPAIPVNLAINTPHISFTIESIVSIVSHFFHSSASISVLQEISPLTHSVLYQLERVIFIIGNNWIGKDLWTVISSIIGLSIFFTGLILYFTRNLSRKKVASRLVVIVGVGYFLLQGSIILHATILDNSQLITKAKHYSNCAVTTPNSTSICHDSRTVKTLSISTAWVYDSPLPLDAVQNIKHIQAMYSNSFVHVYCGTTQCVKTVVGLKNENITARFLVASNLLKNTPLEQWLARQPLNKVLAGIEFEDHLQKAVQLGIMWHYGGIYVAPMVRLTNYCTPLNHGVGWISKNEYSDKSVYEALDVSYFPKNHPFIRKLAENFVHEYPKGANSSLRFHFNFTDTFQRVYNGYCGDLTSNCPITGVHSYEKFCLNRDGARHFGTLSYNERVKKVKVANIGDEMQGLTGMQFLPFVDCFLERDKLSSLKVKEPVTAFLNAWWGSKKTPWPPPSNVFPIMTSMHIEERLQKAWDKQRLIDYFKRNEPIGSRDIQTLEFFMKKGVKSYFSGCLTLMLKNPNVAKRRNGKIYLVDIKENIMKLFPEKVQENGIVVHHNLKSNTYDEMERFSSAYELLETYASAKLVITQRIHCALPCVAIGTPVIFINSPKMPGGGGSKSQGSSRTAGLTPLFHTVDLYTMSIAEAQQWLDNFHWENPPPNPNVSIMMRMRATFWNVIRQDQALNDAARKFGMIPLHPPPVQESDRRRDDKLLFHLIVTSPEFNWHQWRALESIFYHHPLAKVIVHSNRLMQSEFDVLTESGYSVTVQSYNLMEMLKDSLKNTLIKATEIPHWYSHERGLLQLLVLYKWGGIYMDTNVIIVNPVHTLENVLAWKDSSNTSVSGTFMVFKKDNLFLRKCLEKFSHGSKLIDNVLTKVIQEQKNRKDVVVQNNTTLHMIEECFSIESETEYEIQMRSLEEMYTVYLDSSIFEKMPGGSLPEGTLCKHLFNSYCVLCNNQH